MILNKVRAFFERRGMVRERLQAAEDFVWVWADVVNTDAYAYGASLECHEAQVLARLLTAHNFVNHSAEMLAEHTAVCQHDEPHALTRVEG